ncbi:aspartyl-tRNA(Asn)/glutamyl-tRNA(Gln) amidotransferase subunit A [Burkholderia sp. YR290]|jgi:aspartyl-tRNA(Asn)/glutamyl-tRNA(Gln) amidotransferase subunit A|uniref:amidase n=1 Tax=Paraburkholderia hospita TaxID=169430 RepID=UPI0009A83F03|nr:amidase [Paraburkholderia hospita]SKC99540.1 aspartyl-tRNA(Asn)/glutamyl-tRNA(Gln) amidotransferase subunit A [Paraburkholderia hospita]SOE89261.1 aspartyl-tRNA(Asn)/glutamyl-tRNA(Gln) amidotransferase subunit A [Burkholderia sp. YR290]
MTRSRPSSSAVPVLSGLRKALDALAARQTTATALAEQALEEAEASKRSFNAFSAIDWDRALKAAAQSDRRYGENRQRLLEGLPIAIKDLIDTKGIETRYGSAAYVGHVPAVDADVVKALVDQGAIIIGKTTTHEFAWGVSTASAKFGDTLNPLDSTRIPGGSSGGAAVAIASGAVRAGVGTDTGGSVRIPAALCGVVGFKPTHGTISTRGVFPLAPTCDHVGLLGEQVDDIGILADTFGIDLPESDAWISARLGVVREIPPVPLSPEMAAAFDGAIERLEQVFACDEVDTSRLFDTVYESFASIVLIEGGIEHFRRSDWDRIARHYSPETVERLRRAEAMDLRAYTSAQQSRREFAARLHKAMSTVDYLVLPTCPCTAPRVDAGSVTIGDWSGTVREALMTYTAPFNVTGFPAISIPLPRGDSELPTALQIVAKPGDDGALLQIAQQMELMLQAATSTELIDVNTQGGRQRER